MNIVEARIHPAIGIARVGDSPDHHFIGPEIPGVVPDPGGEPGKPSYKTRDGQVKRQAARFRVFGYDERGKVVGEITTTASTRVEWEVHVANRKAAAKRFGDDELRNKDVQGTARDGLVIDPGARALAGPDRREAFDGGSFTYPKPGGGSVTRKVSLGEARTDAEGRLLVLGGEGKAESALGKGLHGPFNNDTWYDETSDGPVSATVVLPDGRRLPAQGAWVIVAPPDYAPAVPPPVSLWERLAAMWLAAPDRPSYTLDIHPVLHSAVMMAWVYAGAGRHHRWGEHGQELPKSRKTAIVDMLMRRPSEGGMPKLRAGRDTGMITERQLEMMKKWRDDEFVKDWGTVPHEITPEGLDRAALMACAGASFNPGIEGGAFLIDAANYHAPLRIRHALGAGAATARMAVPWQADFSACDGGEDGAWWPSQRPNQVKVEGSGRHEAWDRGAETGTKLVQHWRQLGFVARRGEQYVETDRDPHLGT
jgi:hypothetical protein